MENKMTRDELLASCCSKSEYSPNLQRPFLQGGYVIATDAHSLLAVPERDGFISPYPYVDKPNVLAYLNEKCEDFKEIAYQDLLSEYNKLLGEFSKLDNRCPECNGEGRVDYEYFTKEMECHKIKGECPVCHGDGFVDIESHYNEEDYCWITEPGFGITIPRIEVMLDTMRFFGKDNCMLLRKSMGHGVWYRIDDKEFRLVTMAVII